MGQRWKRACSGHSNEEETVEEETVEEVVAEEPTTNEEEQAGVQRSICRS
jgi:hypothetical protein